MSRECPKCAMSVAPEEDVCSFCGAPVSHSVTPLKSLRDKAEAASARDEPALGVARKPSMAALGFLAAVAAVFLLLELVLLVGALSRNPDANVFRFWALVFGVCLFFMLRSLWTKLND